ncbi:MULTISPECIES: GNAT family N-acetyltransferase [Sphingobacterium]|uniref:GNAT family N-acetyltransferase n=1 Tax=Sphingobacterium TaxID=28453 RepID=UPI0013DB0B14|nr:MULTISPECIES: GNAT family protein [unclassified Sphingobacterium]
MAYKTSRIPEIKLSEDVTLKSSSPDQADALYHAIQSNKSYLGQFLPWVKHVNDVSDSITYLQKSQENCEQGSELSYNIFKNNTLVGRIGLHQIDKMNNNASIGYWLTENSQGQGIITTSCVTLLNIGFNELNFQRVEILTATTNTKSTAIPLRLGFVHEGILRQVERHEQQYFDLNIFSILKREWQR